MQIFHITDTLLRQNSQILTTVQNVNTDLMYFKDRMKLFMWWLYDLKIHSIIRHTHFTESSPHGSPGFSLREDRLLSPLSSTGLRHNESFAENEH